MLWSGLSGRCIPKTQVIMLSQKAISPTRTGPALLILAFLYHLGACPCGCWEHNYWLQALGFVPPLATQRSADATPLAVQTEEHDDCTGGNARSFLDNSRTRKSELRLQFAVQQQLPANIIRLGDISSDATLALPPHRGLGRPTCSQLQVFLL